MSEGHSSASLRKRNKKKKRARGGGGEDWDEEPEGVHLYQREQNQDGGDSGGDEPQLIDPEMNFEYQPEQRMEEDIKITLKASPKPERDRSANRGKPAAPASAEKPPSYPPQLNIEDDDEVEDQNNDSSVYKIIFFILFLLLSAISTIVFVENYNNAAENVSSIQEQAPIGFDTGNLDSLIDKRVNNWDIEDEPPAVERRVEFENFEQPLPPEDALDEKIEDAPVEEESEILNWLVSTSEAFAMGLVETLEYIYATLMSVDLSSFYDGTVDDLKSESDALDELDELEDQIVPDVDAYTKRQREQDQGDVQGDTPQNTGKVDDEEPEDDDHDEGFYEERAYEGEDPYVPDRKHETVDPEGDDGIPRGTEETLYGYHENTEDVVVNEDGAADNDENSRRDDATTGGSNGYDESNGESNDYLGNAVGSDGYVRDAWETHDDSAGYHRNPDVNQDNVVEDDGKSIWNDGNTRNFYDTFNYNEDDEHNAYRDHIEVHDRDNAQDESKTSENAENVEGNTVNNEFQRRPAEDPPREQEDTVDLNNNARYYSSMGWTHQQNL